MSSAKQFFALGLVALLWGCATQPRLLNAPSTGSSQEVFATIDDAVKASITALEEKRLGDPKVQYSDRGATVSGELSGLAGAVFNSYGGSGLVSIEAAYPGGTRLKISAATRSRLAVERASSMDALKGYNYSDPKYGREIEARIVELLSKGDIERLRAEEERARLAQEARERMKLAEAEAIREREAAERRRKQAEIASLTEVAARGSRVICASEIDCRKAFALAQIFVSTKTDMKIQLATDTIIETFNPTEDGKMGAKAIKMPGPGQSAEIVLDVSCRTCNHEAKCASLKIMGEFKGFIEARLR